MWGPTGNLLQEVARRDFGTAALSSSGNGRYTPAADLRISRLKKTETDSTNLDSFADS